MVTEIMREASGEAENRRAPPSSRGDPDARVMPTMRAAGNPTKNPHELNNIDYLDSEEQLRRNIHGTKPLSGEVSPQEEDGSAVAIQIDVSGQPNDPKFTQAAELNQRLSRESKLDVLIDTSAQLSSYVRARVAHSLMGGDNDVDNESN